jgi:nucleoside 2-deoxyribosyltransferase
MNSIYLAAPLSEVESVRDWADRLRMSGFKVCSRWHDAVEVGATDPHSRERRSRILCDNLIDLQAADVVFANTCAGVPGATLGEIGWALAMETPVVWLQPPTRRADGVRHTNIFDAHDLVTIVTDSSTVLSAIRAAFWIPPHTGDAA